MANIGCFCVKSSSLEPSMLVLWLKSLRKVHFSDILGGGINYGTPGIMERGSAPFMNGLKNITCVLVMFCFRELIGRLAGWMTMYRTSLESVRCSPDGQNLRFLN